jgi:hypothetical protein
LFEDVIVETYQDPIIGLGAGSILGICIDLVDHE